MYDCNDQLDIIEFLKGVGWNNDKHGEMGQSVTVLGNNEAGGREK